MTETTATGNALQTTGTNRQAGGTNFLPALDLTFSLPEKDWAQYSPLTLAYVGDTIYDLIVRTVLVKRANRPTAKLNRIASSLVCAPAQARLIRAIEEDLTPKEAAIYRRGRNASPATKAKHATMRDYLDATGLEALLGYLYLAGEHERLLTLVKEGLAKTGRTLGNT